MQNMAIHDGIQQCKICYYSTDCKYNTTYRDNRVCIPHSPQKRLFIRRFFAFHPDENRKNICFFLFYSYLSARNITHYNNHLKTNKTMESIIAKIKEQIAAIEKDIDKIENKAAKARVRKATLALEKIGKEYRKKSI